MWNNKNVFGQKTIKNKSKLCYCIFYRLDKINAVTLCPAFAKWYISHYIKQLLKGTDRHKMEKHECIREL